jgi:hypothetical protein
MRKAKNLYFIEKKLIKLIFIVSLFIILIFIIFQKYNFIKSYLIGIFFSFCILRNMINTQNSILSNINAKSFLPRYILRLVLYGIPIFLGLKIYYLKFSIILVSLFAFQVCLLMIILLKSLRKYRKKIKNGT